MDYGFKIENNIEVICRICCNKFKASETISIYSNFNENVQYYRIIMLCFPVHIRENDQLPNNICNKCKVRLSETYNLRELCVSSDKKLRELLTDKIPVFVEVKTEPLEIADICEVTEDKYESDINYDTLNDIKNESDDSDYKPALEKCKTVNNSEKSEELDNIKSETDDSDYSPEKRRKTKKSTGKSKGKYYEKNHECDICNLKFSTLNSLERHKLSHSDLILEHTTAITIPRLDEYKCDFCEITFKELIDMYGHRKQSHIEDQIDDQFKCDYCQKKFKTLDNLRFHLRRHMNEKIRRCNICSVILEVDKRLLEHINRHRDIREFRCETCDKAFKTKASLREHSKMHGTFAFLCPECGKAFKNNSNLRAHMMLHNGEKPYPCTLCPSRFKFRCKIK